MRYFFTVLRYRIAVNFRWVLIFAISRTVYGVAKIKTAIIFSNRYSKVGSSEIAKIEIAEIISHTFTYKSRKFSSAKFSRYTVYCDTLFSLYFHRNPINYSIFAFTLNLTYENQNYTHTHACLKNFNKGINVTGMLLLDFLLL